MSLATHALTALALPLLPALAAAGGESVRLDATDLVQNAQFGYAVATDGSTAVVGCQGGSVGGVGTGTAYVYDVATGERRSKLTPSDGQQFGYFGCAVDVHGETVVVGAYNAHGVGAAYLFDATTGQELARLAAADADPADAFGWSVALHGDRLIVGAPTDDEAGLQAGAAYLIDARTGAELLKLTAPGVSAGARFGTAVAIDANVALVGAYWADTGGTDAGIVYRFDVSTGQLLGKLSCNDPHPSQWFGYSVAVDGPLALVGAPGDAQAGWLAGAAYVFDVHTGEQLAKLTNEAGSPSEGFGASVGLAGRTAVVGVGQGAWFGGAYLFDVPSGRPLSALFPSDGHPNDRFGTSVSIGGQAAVVGAVGRDLWTGAAYAYDTTLGRYRTYCHGLGCPCDNDDPEAGCANGAFGRGAALSASGEASVAQDTLVLHVSASVPNAPGLFFQGDTAPGAAAGVVFGDGLRCAGGSVLRLEGAVADGAGSAASSLSIAAAAGLTGGETRRYQWWYRDAQSSPCGTGFNLSNGLRVDWAP